MEEPIRKFKRPLPCDLTEDEKVKKGHKAGLLKKGIQKIRAEIKLATADFKDRLKEKQLDLDRLLDNLESGTEVRDIECVEQKDFTAKKAHVIRQDTGAIVESRSLMFDELQVKLGNVISEPKPEVDEDEDENGPSLAPKAKKKPGRRKEARA